MGEKCARDGDEAPALPGLSQSFHMREGESNVRINMRPHVAAEGLFDPLLYYFGSSNH